MTIGAAFACAYRRDLVRQSRNAVAKHTRNNQGQAPAATIAKREISSAASKAEQTPPPKDDDVWSVDVREHCGVKQETLWANG